MERGKFHNGWTALAAEAAKEPPWARFVDYCRAREPNLRKRAAEILGPFVKEAQNWTFAERKRFALWLMNSSQSHQIAVPPLLVGEILVPTLVEWCGVAPENAEPQFWLVFYRENPVLQLREVLRVDPSHAQARGMLRNFILTGVGNAQHELPSGYLGDPESDLAKLGEARKLLPAEADPSWTMHVTELEGNAQNWIRLRDQLKGLDWEERLAIWNSRSSQEQA